MLPFAIYGTIIWLKCHTVWRGFVCVVSYQATNSSFTCFFYWYRALYVRKRSQPLEPTLGSGPPTTSSPTCICFWYFGFTLIKLKHQNWKFVWISLNMLHIVHCPHTADGNLYLVNNAVIRYQISVLYFYLQNCKTPFACWGPTPHSGRTPNMQQFDHLLHT